MCGGKKNAKLHASSFFRICFLKSGTKNGSNPIIVVPIVFVVALGDESVYRVEPNKMELKVSSLV